MYWTAMVVVPRFYFSLLLLIAITLSLELFYLFYLEKRKYLNTANLLTLLHMFIYSGGGFKLWVTNKSFKGKEKYDCEELEKLLFQP